MAYVNVKDWSVDQVTDWLKGLDNVILQYNVSFLNNGLTGHQLLNLRADDLEHLGVKALGHQEIILEAVEHLRNFHYELDKENLQLLALRLSCAANSLYKELLLVDDDCTMVQTQVMSDVHTILTTIKPLICWLDRSPFAGDKDYIENKTNLVRLGIEMATSAHRDIFSDKPVRTIKQNCEEFARIADHIIQEICDPMILQPASLDLATLKKKEQELGFFILPNNHAIHQIADIKFGSPAHGSTKIEEGDEIVQVNYQTVVGWQRKKVMMLLQESPPEIVLTLKKRPRHTKVYGQIYMKPYRLPSRKRENWSRWNDSLPSPRLMPILDLPPITITKSIEEAAEVAELSSSDSEPPDSPLDVSCRMYPLKPRPILQRRNTITGSTPTSKRPYPSIEQYWDFIKSRNSTTHASSYNIDDNPKFEDDSKFLRDKSASCNVGLDLSPRPTTVIGLSQHQRNTHGHKKSFNDKEKSSIKKRVNFEEKHDEIVAKDDKRKDLIVIETTNLDDEKSISVNSLASLTNENINFIDEDNELTDRSSMTSDWEKEIVNEIIDVIKTKPTPKEEPNNKQNEMVSKKDPILAEINVHSIIRKFDEQKNDLPKQIPSKPRVLPRSQTKKPPEVPQKPDSSRKPQVPPRSATTKLRGRLDKSHSTPAYDLTGEDTQQIEKLPLVEKVQPVEKLPDVIPNIPETIIETSPVSKEPEYSPFNEKHCELIIPIVSGAEAVNLPLIQNTPQIIEDSEPKVSEEPKDFPPKPPPRIFIEVPKPAYPADSPKPLNLLEVPKNIQTPKRVFEFPESLEVEQYLIPNQIVKSTEPQPVVEEDENVFPKYFEPKMVSTPVTKSKMDFNECDTSSFKCSPSYEMQKSTSDSKISPTNSIVKAMISSKSKAGKKRHNLVAKRRKVTVNDLSPADIQGFLYQRLRGKHNQNVHWEKRWFVLLGNCLYGYKNKDDTRAACLIFLSDFTVSVANEVKSRSNAFKVYHTGTVFYFSADDSDALQSWIDMIKSACNETNKHQDGSLYSETDESDTEKTKSASSEKTESLRKFGSLKKFASKKTTTSDTAHNGSTSLDRKWFFNKSSSHSKNSLPVPTAQFRSYRKIRTNDSQSSITTGNFTSHVSLFAPPSSNLSQMQNVSVPNLTADGSAKSDKETGKSSNRPSKVKPKNYIHASNPSLCNVSEYSGPAVGTKGTKCKDNLAGFMTLEELMIKQSEERKMNPHHVIEEMQINLNLIKPDVVYGEVPIRPKQKTTEEKSDLAALSRSSSASEKQDSTSSCFGKRLGSLKRNHHHKEDEFGNKTATYPKITKVYEQKVNKSLPRAHKMQESYQQRSETDLPPTKFKERSYEMIFCPETVNDVQFAQNRMLDNAMCQDAPKKHSKLRKQHSFSGADKKSKSGQASGKVKLKSALQYTPMALPLSHDNKSKPKFAFELNLDEKQTKGGKLKQMFGGKSEKKEKTFLGSPKLHRAIFRKHSSGNDLSWPSGGSSPQVSPVSMSQSTYSLENSPPLNTEPFLMNIRPHADYPGLEYPPVFEPETYSLANPQSSLSLLRKQTKKDFETDSK